MMSWFISFDTERRLLVDYANTADAATQDNVRDFIESASKTQTVEASVKAQFLKAMTSELLIVRICLIRCMLSIGYVDDVREESNDVVENAMQSDDERILALAAEVLWILGAYVCNAAKCEVTEKRMSIDLDMPPDIVSELQDTLAARSKARATAREGKRRKERGQP